MHAVKPVPRSAWTRAVSRVVFPLHERLKRHSSVAFLRDLEQSQWWEPQRIERLRVERLRTMLEEIRRHVPYYRRLFDEAKFEPTSVRSVADLAALPFLTKALVRANTDAMRADDACGLRRNNTGGSSGEPMVFYVGRDRVSHDVAAKWRATRWWGVDIGDPEIVVWGSPIELGAQDRLRSLRDRLLRTTLLPAFEMSEAKLDEFVATIRRVRPKMLFGYPSAFAHIAAHAKRRGVRLDNLGIVVAFVTSERLYDHQREQIAGAFGCQVANGYGGRDAGFVAHECPAGGMHVSAEDVIVEIAGSDGRAVRAGEAGEIVVTHLATRDFPFVRYRTGDMGVLDDRACACGRGLPLLREIQGRTTDFIVAEDGTVMHGLALIYILRDLPGIATFKIVQESRERIRVQIVPERDLQPGVEAQIVDDVRRRVGRGVNVSVELVDEIPPDRSGKFRYVVSRVETT